MPEGLGETERASSWIVSVDRSIAHGEFRRGWTTNLVLGDVAVDLGFYPNDRPATRS